MCQPCLVGPPRLLPPHPGGVAPHGSRYYLRSCQAAAAKDENQVFLWLRLYLSAGSISGPKFKYKAFQMTKKYRN